MPGGVPVVPTVPDEKEFQAWKAQQASSPAAPSPFAPVPDEAEFQQWKAQQGAPGQGAHDYHAEFKAGTLAKRMKRENTSEQEAAQTGEGGPMEALARGTETTVNALPGGGMLMAASRAAGQGIPFKQAEEQQNQEIGEFKQENPKASTALGVAANIPLFNRIPQAILASRAGGAAVGGTVAGGQRLLSTEHPGEAGKQRVWEAAKDAGIGAGVGAVAPWLVTNPVARTAVGAGLGAYAAPDGLGSKAAGTVAGGAAAYKAPFLTELAAKGANKLSGMLPSGLVNAGTAAAGTARSFRLQQPNVGSRLQGLAEASSTKGVVNHQLNAVNDAVAPLGGIVGETSPAGKALTDAVAARSAGSAQRYPQALSEADAAVGQYRAGRQQVLDENTQRMADALRIEQENAAQMADQSTSQSRAVVPTASPSIREAIDNFERIKAEAARRTPVPARGPFQSPPQQRPVDLVAEDRFNQFLRDEEGISQTELETTALAEPGHGGGVPQNPETHSYLPGQEPPHTEPPLSAETPQQERARQALTQDEPYRTDAPPAVRGAPVRTDAPVVIPSLQMHEGDDGWRNWAGADPERSQTAARRGPAPSIHRSNGEPILEGETALQRHTREALERRSAYAALPPTTPDAPLQTPPAQLPVPGTVHPAVAPIYQNERIAKVAAALGNLHEFGGMDRDDPRFLDGLYKVFSDQKGALAQRIENATGDGGVNLGRYTKADIAHAQSQILDAFDGMQSTYRDAVAAHASDSRMIDAYRRGYDMVGKTGGKSKTVVQHSPEAFEAWLQHPNTTPEEQQHALAGAKDAMRAQAADAPLEGGAEAVLAKKPFRTTGNDARKRAVVGYPEELRTKIAADAAKDGAFRKALAKTVFYQTRGYVQLPGGDPSQTALNSSKGIEMLGKLRQNPQAYQDVLRLYRGGVKDKRTLAGISSALVGNTVGQH